MVQGLLVPFDRVKLKSVFLYLCQGWAGIFLLEKYRNTESKYRTYKMFLSAGLYQVVQGRARILPAAPARWSEAGISHPGR